MNDKAPKTRSAESKSRDKFFSDAFSTESWTVLHCLGSNDVMEQFGDLTIDFGSDYADADVPA